MEWNQNEWERLMRLTRGEDKFQEPDLGPEWPWRILTLISWGLVAVAVWLIWRLVDTI